MKYSVFMILQDINICICIFFWEGEGESGPFGLSNIFVFSITHLGLAKWANEHVFKLF